MQLLYSYTKKSTLRYNKWAYNMHLLTAAVAQWIEQVPPKR